MTDEQRQRFFERETSLHKKEFRNSRDKVSELIADDFLEFGKSGLVFNKQQVVEYLAGEGNDLEITVTDFEVRELAPTVVLVLYTATMLDSDKTTVPTKRSSIWVYRDEKWQMAFHQGTKVKVY
jgi:hypothetical protein